MSGYPLVSIVVPTYNSESTIGLVLDSINKQSYKNLELIIVDGGSEDGSLKIAKQYHAVLLKNPKQHQVYAKHLGFLKARGKYILHLDADEVLENHDSIALKVKLFQNKKLRAIVPSGHKTPPRISGVNKIINDIGDPFSYYMYGFSFNHLFFIDKLKRKFEVVYESDDYVIIDFRRSRNLPGIEMSASGIMIDSNYVKNEMPLLKKHPRLISQVFYHLVNDGDLVGFIKNDPVLHYSASNLSKYLKKLKSRVMNNVFQTEMGKSAFSGRGEFYSLSFKLKKYLFIPYSYTLLLPLVEGFKLSIARRDWIFLNYPLFCLYISSLILYYMVQKTFGLRPKIKGYGY